MSSQITPDSVPTARFAALYAVLCGLAIEGVPVAAIARATRLPSAEVRENLQHALEHATISRLPKHDWAPSATADGHLPIFELPPVEDMRFSIRRLFRLTPLEAAFLVALLRSDHCDKGKLHSIIEQLRNIRTDGGPNDREVTNEKMVDVMICKLRKRLKSANVAYEIKTVWGSGYYIDKAVRREILKAMEAVDASPTTAPPARDQQTAAGSSDPSAP